MGKQTGIEWADATVNIWTGCTKVSPACKHCYAETNTAVRVMEARLGEAERMTQSIDGKRKLTMWGVDGYRYETAGWERELRALNRKAKRDRVNGGAAFCASLDRPRVFINSLSDTFEDWQGVVKRIGNGEPVTWAHSLDDVRRRFFRVAEECTELDILLLTKRPENVLRMVPQEWLGRFEHSIHGGARRFYADGCGWPSHVWIGTTVEDQAHADKRIPELLKVPAKVRFLSVEPLLGKVDLCATSAGDILCRCDGCLAMTANTRLQWVIVGGESGTNARPMNPDWVRTIRDQCQAAGVPFFFKQWGEWGDATSTKNGLLWVDSTGKTSDNVWDFAEDGDHVLRQKVGKKNAGRVLDGRTWDEVPR